MTRSIWALLCAAAVIGVSGCGGGGSKGSSPTFAGRYVGATTTTPAPAISHTSVAPQTGALELRIAANGSISGFLINTTSTSSSNISGTISSAGVVSLTTSTTIYTGTLTMSGSTLSGTLTDATGGTTPLSLSSIPSGSNPYAGLVSGNFADSNGDLGSVEMINNTEGTVLAGLAVDNTKHTTGTLTGSISNAGAVNITSSNSNWTVTGTLTFTTANNITGTLTLAGGGTSTVALRVI